jgi:FkbM family methyltransferase
MSIFKSIIKKAVQKAGYQIQKRNVSAYINEDSSMVSGLNRMKSFGVNPNIVLDIGAAQGTWTQKSLRSWPDAKYELIEPLNEQEEILSQLKSLHPNINYHLAVAGESPGQTWLNVSPDLDGSGVYGNREGNARKVPVIVVDDIVKGMAGNILIKMDTHGYEVPILKGAQQALKRTTLLVIEVYGFYISPTCLLFHELSTYLDKLGFRLIDLVDIMRRPGDRAFWQADAFYIRKDNPVFETNSYV